MRKNCIKTIIFLAIFVFLFQSVMSVLSWKDTVGTERFYHYPEQSIDVIFYGSSHTDCTINNAVLWDKYGIASYNFSEHGQSLISTYYYMEESLKTQNPKVMAVELTFASWYDEGLDNGNFYRNTLSLPMSFTSWKNIRENAGLIGKNDLEYALQLFLKFPVLHSRYKTLSEYDFEESDDLYSNYGGSWEIGGLVDEEEYRKNHKQEQLDFIIVSELIERMITLADENNIEIIFWVSPFYYTENDEARFKQLKQFLDDKNQILYNFNEMKEELSLDYSQDMRKDGSHVNNYGAEKVTLFFGEMLKNEYQIPDRSNESMFTNEPWNQIAKRWDRELEVHQFSLITDPFEYFTALSAMDDVMVLVRIDGGFEWLDFDGYHEVLKMIGIDKYPDFGDIYVVDDQRLVQSYLGQDSLRKVIKINDKEMLITKGKAISYSGKEGIFTSLHYFDSFSRVYESGMNVTVIDKTTGYVISNTGFVWIDIYN